MVGELGSTTKGSAKCGNGRAKLRLSDGDVGTAALIFLCTQKLTITVLVRRLRKFDGGLGKGATGQDSQAAMIQLICSQTSLALLLATD